MHTAALVDLIRQQCRTICFHHPTDAATAKEAAAAQKAAEEAAAAQKAAAAQEAAEAAAAQKAAEAAAAAAHEAAEAAAAHRSTSYVPIVLQQIGEGFSQIHLWPLGHAGLFTRSLRVHQLLPVVDHTE